MQGAKGPLKYAAAKGHVWPIWIRHEWNSRSLNRFMGANLYIIIGLSPCVSTGVAWMDRRSRARQAQAASGTSKAGQTNGRADGQADGPNRAKILSRPPNKPYYANYHHHFRLTTVDITQLTRSIKT